MTITVNNTFTHLFIDLLSKMVYQLPLEEVERIELVIEEHKVKNYAPTTYVPHLPRGFTNFNYISYYVGDINVNDYIKGNRYLIIEDTPAARVLYGSPVNMFML